MAACAGAVTRADRAADEVRVAFTADVFAGINRTDAEASIKAWIETVASNRGFQKRAVVSVYDDLASLKSAVARGEVDLAILQSHEFVQIEGATALTPVFTPARGDGVYDHIILVVNASSSRTDLGQLQGSTIVAHSMAGWTLGELWLNHELRTRGLPEVDGFFGRVEQEKSPNRVILPVFFGNREVCIISRKMFDVAAELNPQVRQRLRPLLGSPGIAAAVVCVWASDWPHKEDLLAALRELHTSVQGQQILTVFKIDQLVPYVPEHLREVRAIVDTDLH